jgi:1-acyl-sn-glycerol-3-phosphate acyltransferase
VMYELMGLSGQEYVDIYAADVKEAGDGAAEAARIPATAVS